MVEVKSHSELLSLPQESSNTISQRSVESDRLSSSSSSSSKTSFESNADARMQSSSEPTMLLQRPCFKSQSVSHVLARAFRDMFSYDVMKTNIIDNLYASCTPSYSDVDDYHLQYVNALRSIQEAHEQKMKIADMLEEHILEAQSFARNQEYNEKNEIKQSGIFDSKVYCPPVPDHFKLYCNNELLSKHDLICAQDFMKSDIPSVKFPVMKASDNKLSTQITSSDIINEDRHKIQRSSTALLKKKIKSSSLKLKNENVISSCNPLVKTTSIKNTRSIISKNSLDVFIFIPNEIIFTDYEIGKVYQRSLELKNVSSSLKFIRVIPPTTNYFTINFGSFPSERGSIAAGLSCQYAIQFCADSLMDYEDFIIVQPEDSRLFKIPIRALRQPPCLNLPDCIQIGDCLLGTKKTFRFTIKNCGGDGRFTIIPVKYWPATDFTDIIVDNHVMLGSCIEVQPAMFELKRDTDVEIVFMFAPDILDDYEEIFVLVCDNCNTRYISVKGHARLPEVSLICTEHDLNDYDLGEVPDCNAQYLMKFPPISISAVEEKSFSVQNCIDVDIEFYWLFVRPYKCKNPFEDASQDVLFPKHRVADENSCFSVEPNIGILPALCQSSFVIKYCPNANDEFCNLLCLVLKYKTTSLDNEDKDQEVTGLTIEVIGSTSKDLILIEPNIFIIQKIIPLLTLEKRKFFIHNKTASSIYYDWDLCHLPCELFVKPQTGVIAANHTEKFELNLCSERSTKVDHVLLCKINNGLSTLALYISANFEGAQIKLCQPDVCFGEIEYGTTKSVSLTFANISSIPAKWVIDGNNAENLSHISFSPSASGELGAQESTTIVLNCSPTFTGPFLHYLTLRVLEGNESLFQVYGTCQKPFCLLIPDELRLQAFVQTSVDCLLTLHNPTEFATNFEWLQPEEWNFGILAIEPSIGNIAGKENIKIKLTFKGFLIASMTNLCLQCKIGDTEIVNMNLNINVNGLSVDYKTSPTPFLNVSNEIYSDHEIDFGYENKVGTILKYYLHIENLTPIESSFDVNVEHYKATSSHFPSPPKIKTPSTRRYLLKKTSNYSEKDAKTDKQALFDLSKEILSERRGVAFLIKPTTSILPAYSTVTVEVIAFSDTWGTYMDRLVCQVGDLETKYIPVKLTVHGCPINFQMFDPQNTPTPITFRFGTQLLGSSVVEKSACIINYSAIDVSLNWNLSRLFEFDEQLLDLIPAFYGMTEDNEQDPDVEDDGSSQQQVISLKLVQHVGVKSVLKKPFEIEPKNLIIPAHSMKDIKIKLYPPNSICDDNNNSFHFAATAHINISKEDEFKESILHRKKQYDLPSFQIHLLADIVKPLLNIEYYEMDEFQFRCSAGHLLDINSRNILPKEWILSRGKLINPLNCDLSFKISLKEPFYLIESNPINNLINSYNTTSTIITLKPNTSKLITLGFCLTTSLIQSTDISNEIKLVENLQAPERTLTLHENLIIHFLNGSTKEPLMSGMIKLNMRAIISMPRFECSNTIIDFGQCGIYNNVTSVITITNPTNSNTYWNISPELNSDTDGFSFSPTCGFLMNKNTAENTSLLTVIFTPTIVRDYECYFVMRGLLEEPVVRILVKGAAIVEI